VPKWFDLNPESKVYLARQLHSLRTRPERDETSKRDGIMNPTAKPVKKSKKLEPAKKLERKTPLMAVRSLTVKW